MTLQYLLLKCGFLRPAVKTKQEHNTRAKSVRIQVGYALSPHCSRNSRACGVRGVHVPRVVSGRCQRCLPGDVTLSGLILRVTVILRHGLGVGAFLGLSKVHVVRVGGIHEPIPLFPVQETFQRHGILLGEEEGGLREVLAHSVHLPGALQVEQYTCSGGVVNVTVVLEQLVVEQAVISEADGLQREGNYHVRLNHNIQLKNLVLLKN